MTSTLPESSKSVIQAHQSGTETPINVDAQEYMQDAAWRG